MIFQSMSFIHNNKVRTTIEEYILHHGIINEQLTKHLKAHQEQSATLWPLSDFISSLLNICIQPDMNNGIIEYGLDISARYPSVNLLNPIFY